MLIICLWPLRCNGTVRCRLSILPITIQLPQMLSHKWLESYSAQVCINFLKLVDINIICSVHWALSIPAFHTLCRNDQKLLLEETLNELLVLTLMQQTIAVNTDPTNYAPLVWNNYFTNTIEQQKLSDIINYIRSLQLNQTEFTCLKVLLLFRPGQ